MRRELQLGRQYREVIVVGATLRTIPAPAWGLLAVGLGLDLDVRLGGTTAELADDLCQFLKVLFAGFARCVLQSLVAQLLLESLQLVVFDKEVGELLKDALMHR